MNACKRLWLIGAAGLALAAGSAVAAAPPVPAVKPVMQSVPSYQNDTSLPLYYLPAWHKEDGDDEEGREQAENPHLPNHHVDKPDTVVDHGNALHAPAPRMPDPSLSFDGVVFPGVGCNCAPPDTNGQVGVTQYVQIVNDGFQVFDKTTGATLLGPNSITSVWSGFGGACETGGFGDPVLLYDQLADRWVMTEFASPSGGTPITDECVAVSTTNDATGTWNRYGFHLGGNFFDYPKVTVWPDGYYMSMNVFNSGGTAFLGPQAFAFDRQAMLDGTTSSFITSGITGGANEDSFQPTNIDGLTPPPLGAPNTYVEFPGTGVYKIFQFHADFATPANSTFTLFDSPAAADFTAACTGGRSCVPQLGVTSSDKLDGLADRLMFRLGYRNFGDHESLVGNYTVSSGGVAAVRWFEFRNVTAGPVEVYQESTYQPDTTWRWMGSASMDSSGNIVIGYSASSSTIHPQIRYAGRLASDPLNTLPQAEAHLIDGTGSQTGTGNRWGDYSSLTVDPVDDCTFWYTSEYYVTTAEYGWSTRIGSFKLDSCGTPTFALSSTDLTQDVCAMSATPTSLDPVTVDIASRNGFTDDVEMSFGDGLPTGFTGTYTVNPVTPPGTTDADLAVDDTATPGANSITLRGSSDGVDKDLVVTANVSTIVAAAPTLLTPQNAATSTVPAPVFTWKAVPQATSYLIEIASDAAFTNIVVSQTVSTTTFTPAAPLATDTPYFWRVTAGNVCGTGVSTVFTFTTQPGPGQCSTGTPTQTLFTDDVENGDNGWTHAAASGSVDTWTRGSASHSGSFAWQANAPGAGTANDQWLISPSVTLPATLSGLNLQFWNEQSLKPDTGGCYDGAILEVSSDGGSTWTQRPPSTLLTDPYDGPISGSFGNPLAGDLGWCGSPQPYLNSIVDLQSYAGQTVKFRFNLGHDRFAHHANPNWAIDDISVVGCGTSEPTDRIFADGFDGVAP
jgi:hypothetical protein